MSLYISNVFIYIKCLYVYQNYCVSLGNINFGFLVDKKTIWVNLELTFSNVLNLIPSYIHCINCEKKKEKNPKNNWMNYSTLT